MKRSPRLVPSLCSLVLIAIITLTVSGTASAINITQDRMYDRVWHDYLPTLHEHFIDHLELDDGVRRQLVAHRGTGVRLKLMLDRQGRITTVDVLDQSEVKDFTRACVQAARAMGRLPKLPPPILKRGRTDGVEFVFRTQ